MKLSLVLTFPAPSSSWGWISHRSIIVLRTCSPATVLMTDDEKPQRRGETLEISSSLSRSSSSFSAHSLWMGAKKSGVSPPPFCFLKKKEKPRRGMIHSSDIFCSPSLRLSLPRPSHPLSIFCISPPPLLQPPFFNFASITLECGGRGRVREGGKQKNPIMFLFRDGGGRGSSYVEGKGEGGGRAVAGKREERETKILEEASTDFFPFSVLLAVFGRNAELLLTKVCL